MQQETKEQQERALEEGYVVRQVTHVQASWAERERGKPGRFVLQLILDNGADEYIICPHAGDMRALLRLFKEAPHPMFDKQRKLLMFGDVSV
ncbi:MAG: hypothetical protein M3120_07425 [Pseudomonadota bacterium]|jgi:hypothetical protein|nr:hypothetical protein [Pseudomonadota bacterium]